MIDTQISLTEEQTLSLQMLAHQLGKTPNDLIKEAVVKLIGQLNPETLLRNRMAACGIWRDRDDIPDSHELRGSAERFHIDDVK